MSVNRVLGRSASMIFAFDRPKPPMPPARDCCACRPAQRNTPKRINSGRRLSSTGPQEPPPRVAVISTCLAWSRCSSCALPRAVGIWLVKVLPFASFPRTPPLSSMVTDLTSPAFTFVTRSL
jgi:hypothetical protein